MSRPVGLIGVPTSAGAFAPGQEQAPQALRDAGLVESLHRAGVLVRDHRDREAWRWRPDRDNRRAQNLNTVVEIVRDTARRVAEAVSAGEATLVLGGDCTIGIGTVAGQLATGDQVGLVYFDAHADLNVPSNVREGAIDWMGLAHMLGEDGAATELVNVGSRTPLLHADQVLLFAWDSEQSTPFERTVIERRHISVIPVDEVAMGPEVAARRARELIEDRCDRLASSASRRPLAAASRPRRRSRTDRRLRDACCTGRVVVVAAVPAAIRQRARMRHSHHGGTALFPTERAGRVSVTGTRASG